MSRLLSGYFPGIVLFLTALMIAMLTYQDYGVSWDEPIQRTIGKVSYDYVFNGSNELLTYVDRQYGTAFELPLVMIEKGFHITDTRDIYLMRHLVTHLFFLVAALFTYVLIFRLYRSPFLACMGFIMLVAMPRIYAHSFFNSKDVPFLAAMLITLSLCQLAFDKNRGWLFVVLGAACGYTTALRIMGIMLAGFIMMLFVVAIINADKAARKKMLLMPVLFLLGFCLAVYIPWPYLWHDPVHALVDSFSRFSHFDLAATTLFMGRIVPIKALPPEYFPVWFGITVPELWLAAGIGGIVLIVVSFFKSPFSFIQTKAGQQFLLHLGCFIVPVVAVIAMHSTLYDDWRHLYFVYGPFVLVAVYFMDKILRTKFKKVVYVACVLQFATICYTVSSIHPFQQVYFNHLVSHRAGYLHANYDMEYWGAGYKQALEYLAAKHPQGTIKVSSNITAFGPLPNNIQMLRQRDRVRFEIVDEHFEYFITNLRGHPEPRPYLQYPVTEYAISAFNSDIICIYKP